MKRKGKQTLYNEKIHLPVLAALARRGMTNKEIADIIGVSERQLYRWQEENPSIRQTLSENKLFADSLVENSLYKRAIGYDYEEVETYMQKNKDGEIVTRKKVTKKHCPADMGAISMWLKCRMPDVWREIMQIDASSSFNTQNDDDLRNKTTEELKEIARILRGKSSNEQPPKQ